MRRRRGGYKILNGKGGSRVTYLSEPALTYQGVWGYVIILLDSNFSDESLHRERESVNRIGYNPL